MKIILFLLFLFSTQLAFGQSSIDDLIGKGTYAMTQNENYQAIDYFDQVLEIDQNNIDALKNKGESLNNLERYEEAHMYFDQILQIEPSNVNAALNKGYTFLLEENYYKALIVFRFVLQIDPENLDAKNNASIASNNLTYEKHDGTLEVIVRDQNGKIGGYQKIDRVHLLDNKVTDDFLDTWILKEIIIKDNQKFAVKQYSQSVEYDNDKFLGGFRIGLPPIWDIAVVSSEAHGIVTQTGDVVEFIFTIPVATLNK